MSKVDNASQQIFYHSIPLQCISVLSAITIGISVGMHYGWPSPSIPLLQNENSEIRISNSDGSWLAAMQFIGLIVACIAIPQPLFRIGSKACLLIASPISFLAWLLIAYAPNIFVLQMARFLAGTVDGIVFTSLPVYIGELSDRRIRGFFWCLVDMACKIGILAMAVIGVHFDIKNSALMCSTVPIFHFLTFYWMPETPYFLARKEARNFDQFIAEHNVQQRTWNAIAERTAKPLFKLRNLLKKPIDRKSLLIVLVLEIIVNSSGHMAITFYLFTIFSESGGAFNESTSTFIYLGVQTLANVVGGALMDVFGRKPLLITSSIGSMVALTIEGLYFYFKNETSFDITTFGFLPLTALMMYAVAFSLGFATVPHLLAAELFTTKNKAIMIALCNITFAIFSIATAKFFQHTKDLFGMHVPFFTFSIACGLGLLFVIFFVPETKGKTLEHIQKDALSAGDIGNLDEL